MSINTYVCIFMCICMYRVKSKGGYRGWGGFPVCIYVYLYIHIYIYMNIYIYIYIYIERERVKS
jgi:hypothetical protein